MSGPRPGPPGATRSCPHCKATILDSASVCPACRGHLRFDDAVASTSAPALVPLKVEGTLRQPASGAALEYTMVLSIRDGAGKEVARQVIGVGAIQPEESRTFSLAVEASETTGRRGKR